MRRRAALVNTVRSQVVYSTPGASELEMNCTGRLNTPRFTATARNKDGVNATLSNRWARPPILSEENMGFRPFYALRVKESLFFPSTAPPTFTEGPPPVLEALVGSHVSLSCRATGSPPPSITWSKDGSVIQRVSEKVWK